MSIARFSLSLGLLMAVASPAMADGLRFPRWYVGGTVGGVYQSDYDLKPGSDLSHDVGYGLSGKVGYLLPVEKGVLSNVRLEGEFLYQRNDIDENVPGGKGDTSGKSAFVNAVYDLNNDTNFTPYIGAGFGATSVKIQDSPTLGIDSDSDTRMSYQLMSGVMYEPDALPQTQWVLGYRFLHVPGDLEFTDVSGGKVRMENYNTQTVETGVNLKF